MEGKVLMNFRQIKMILVLVAFLLLIALATIVNRFLIPKLNKKMLCIIKIFILIIISASFLYTYWIVLYE